MEWDPPLSLGGRNDTMYILWYQVAGSNQEDNPIIEGPTVSTTMGTITGKHQQETYQCGPHLFFSGLISGVQYNTYVSAINGVSDQVERNMPSLVIASSPPSPPPVVIIVIVVLVATLVMLFLSVTCIM